MLRKITIAAVALISLIALASLGGCGKSEDTSKTEQKVDSAPDRSVPEMDAFVEAFQMISALRNAGKCESARDSIFILMNTGNALASATLPEFYNDVADEFKLTQEELSAGLQEFKTAAEGLDDHLTKEKFENIRATLISMVNLLSPDIKELDEMHEVVAELWHDALPAKDYDKIRQDIPKLMRKAALLNQVTLPEKYAFLQDSFHEKTTALVKSIDNLAEVCLDDSLEDQIDGKMEEMHDAYHNVTTCLDGE